MKGRYNALASKQGITVPFFNFGFYIKIPPERAVPCFQRPFCVLRIDRMIRIPKEIAFAVIV